MTAAARADWEAAADADGFMFVSDRLPLAIVPTGFVDRYVGFLRALAERAPTTLVVGTHRSVVDETGLDERALREQLVQSLPELTEVEVRPVRAARSGLRRLMEAAQALAQPRLANTPIPELASATEFPGVLVVTHASMAHLGYGRAARGLLTVYVLEEGFERAPRNESGLSPARRRASAMAHAARRVLIVHRIFRRVDAEGAPVVVMSPTERTYFARWIRRSPMTLIPLSVTFPDDRAVREARHDTRSAGAITVGIFGRIGDDRNALATIDLLELDREPNHESAGAETADRSTHLPPRHWLIVGSNPPAALTRLAADTVTITGYVADMGPYYEQADIAVIPATSVTGNKSTLLKAWAYALPVVICSASVSTMPVRHEVNAIVGDTTADLLRGVERLSRDPDLRDGIGRAGHRSALAFESTRMSARFAQLAASGSPEPGD